MAQSPRRSAIVISSAALLSFVAWTLLALGGVLNGFDRATAYPGLTPNSPAAQIWSAIAIVTWPAVLYAVVLGVSFWAWRRRLYNLAWASVIAVAAGWGGHLVLKLLFQRPRPATPLEVITDGGWAYPSGHVTAAVASTIIVATTLEVTRQDKATRIAARLAGGALILLIAVNRWVMNAHWASDIIGGALWGATATSLALLATGVQVLPVELVALLRRQGDERRALPASPVAEVDDEKLKDPKLKRCAIIYNPTKLRDRLTFQRHVEFELEHRGWDRPIWLETTKLDPGYQMAQVAVRKKVDLVLGAGGDGTIRAVCEGLSGSDIPFAIIPAGTGNLLARNVGVPLDQSEALRAAFEGTPRALDLIKLTVDHDATHVFAVMAGIGIDAAIMESTDSELKKAVGSAAYFIAAAQNANHPPLPVTITIDDRPPVRRKAAVVLIGNVGFLQGGIQLIPDASPSDGKLDLLVATPRGLNDWMQLTRKVLTRQQRGDDRLEIVSGRRVEIEAERSDAYQLDGDTEGRARHLVAEVMPSALKLMLPRG